MTYTCDEISAMTDDELILAVAKAKGLAMVGIPHTDTSPDGELVDLGTEWIINPDIPDWTYDIAAAWGLWDEMKQTNDVLLSIQWVGYKQRYFTERNLFFEPYAETMSDAATAPRAIAEAYLLWKQTQGE